MRSLVLIAGRPSHGPGAHEHRAGMLLLKRCLESVPDLEVTVYDGGWPSSDAPLGRANAIAVFADGGEGHPLLAADHLATISRLVEEQGIGLGLMHYAVELPEGDGARRVDAWIGGHYESGVSCNPIWEARIEPAPDHPVTRGVTPFATTDEWYFNIQFGAVAAPDEGSGHTIPLLAATPSDAVRGGPYVHPQGPYPEVVAASGRRETLMWVHERRDGGRGFGLTGGHFHANWANDAFRTATLNALVWLAGGEVPLHGVESSVAADDLTRNLDTKA